MNTSDYSIISFVVVVVVIEPQQNLERELWAYLTGLRSQ